MENDDKVKTSEAQGIELKRMSISSGIRNYALAAFVSLIGLADAIYLTVEHLTGNSVRCTVTSGCSEVLGSAYASIGGVPLAGLGAMAYFIVFSLATLAAFGHRWIRDVLAAIVGIMLAMTFWLLFVQAFVLHAFCQYCLLSAAVTLILSAFMASEQYRRWRNLAFAATKVPGGQSTNQRKPRSFNVSNSFPSTDIKDGASE